MEEDAAQDLSKGSDPVNHRTVPFISLAVLDNLRGLSQDSKTFCSENRHETLLNSC